MKKTNTALITLVLISLAACAHARGFGEGPSAGQDTSRASRTPGPDLSAARPSSGMTRGSSAPARVAPQQPARPPSAPASVPTYSPAPVRVAPQQSVRAPSAPVSAFTPSVRSVPGGPARENPAPQVRAYTAPRAAAGGGAPAARTRAEEAPRAPAGNEAAIRSGPATVRAPETRLSGLGGAASRREDGARAPALTTTRVASDDNARSSGTARGGVQTRQEAVSPAAPTVARRTAEPQGAPVTRLPERTQPLASKRPQTDATRPSLPSATAPDTRLASPASTRGASGLRFGTAGDSTRSRASLPPTAGTAPRSTRFGDATSLAGRSALTESRAPRLSGGRPDRSVSDRNPTTSSRYSDGRSALYRAPDRYAYMDRHSDVRSRPDRHDFSGGHPCAPRHDVHHHDHHDSHYYHFACAPVWCGPVVYPAGYSFGFSWSNGSYGLGFSYYPAYAYTPYYDSWWCGGWGYSGVYYGGWRDNWYGGFSYVYNPWPVYRTYYLYEPAPVVTRIETVYVNQPTTTAYAAPATADGPAVQPIAEAVPEPLPPPQTARVAASAAARVETPAVECLCPCHCNGQRPCTCAYPCGAEYAVEVEQFDLGLAYRSYAETLSPETIWSSYAGLDRWDANTEPALYEATASADNSRR